MACELRHITIDEFDSIVNLTLRLLGVIPIDLVANNGETLKTRTNVSQSTIISMKNQSEKRYTKAKQSKTSEFKSDIFLSSAVDAFFGREGQLVTMVALPCFPRHKHTVPTPQPHGYGRLLLGGPS